MKTLQLTEEQKDFLKKCLFISSGSINYNINALGILNSNSNNENYNINFYVRIMKAKYKTFEIFKEREFVPNLVSSTLSKNTIQSLINSNDENYNINTLKNYLEFILKIYNYSLIDVKTEIKNLNNNYKKEEVIDILYDEINNLILHDGTKVTDNRYTNRLLKHIETIYNEAQPITIEEAFLIKCKTTQVLAFDCIDPVEFFKNSKTKKRISVDGKEMKYYRFADETGYYNENGDFSIKEKEGYNYVKKYDRYDFVKHNIYEVYSINISEISEDANDYDLGFAVRCWCTSTNEEAWIWLDKNREPLDAIASVHKIPKSIYSKIKKLISDGYEVLFKRQGDTIYFENDEIPLHSHLENEELIPLSKEEYFNMLICET